MRSFRQQPIANLKMDLPDFDLEIPVNASSCDVYCGEPSHMVRLFGVLISMFEAFGCQKSERTQSVDRSSISFRISSLVVRLKFAYF